MSSAAAAAAGERTEMQRKTFSRWANSYLNKRQLGVQNVTTDFADGIMLANLLELLSKESLPKYNKTPKIEIQKLENLNTCLKFITDHKVQIVNIGSKDIYGGNEKLILGLLWTLILRWEVTEDGKNGLLLWVQRSCKGYRDVDPPNVQNFHNSWCDGLAFCALIHRYRPDLINYDDCKKSEGLANCELAFSIAEEKLGIARLLDAQDVVSAPDEKSVIAYVSQFFKLFALANKNEGLIKSIKNAVEVTKRHDQWTEQFESGSSQVLSWSQTEAERLAAPITASTTEEVKSAVDSFKDHMKNDKSVQQAKLNEIEGVYNTLLNSKKNNKRPEHKFAIELSQLESAWDSLEAAESEHERVLLDMYVRFLQVDRDADKFMRSAATIESWLDNALKVFKAGHLGHSVTEIESNLDAQENTERRLAQVSQVCQGFHLQVNQIETLAAGQHIAGSTVVGKMADLDQKLAECSDAAKDHRGKLENALAAAKAAVLLKRSFANEYDDLVFELQTLKEQIDEPVAANSMKEIESRSAAIKDQASRLSAASANADKVVNMARELNEQDSIAKAGNQKDLCQKLSDMLTQKQQALAAATGKEEEKEALRKEFADKANKFDAECEKFKAALGNSSGSLEDQLAAVRAVRAQVEAHSQSMAPIQEISDKCEAANVIGNPYTVHTLFTLRASLDQIQKSVAVQESSISAQIMAKKSLDVTPEQVKEIADIFTVFDQDKSGRLHLAEVKEACQGAGIDLPDEEVERKMKARRASMSFSLEDFTDFMIQEMKKGDTIDDVVNAFKELSGGHSSLSPETLSQTLQSEPGLLAYIESNMSNGDYVAFTNWLFSR